MAYAQNSDMRLVVLGAAGRMGKMLIRAIAQTPGVALAAAIERAGASEIGQDAGALAGLRPLDVPITDNLLQAIVAADGIIDFTTPSVTIEAAALAAQARIVHVIGTTGLSEEDLVKIVAASRHAPIIRSGNMSLGVNLLAVLAERAAQALGAGWDIEILEMHHKAKVDAPSGTALLLGDAAARGRNVTLQDHYVATREGHIGGRREGEIGFATLRGGTVVGDHMVIFAGTGERIELVHRAEDRGIFAAGAVKAAQWGRGKPPGQYSMRDVLGLADLK